MAGDVLFIVMNQESRVNTHLIFSVSLSLEFSAWKMVPLKSKMDLPLSVNSSQIISAEMWGPSPEEF